MIRPALEKDLESIVSIYNQAVSLGYATADTESIPIASRQEWFVEHNYEKYPIFVWEENEEVLAWLSINPYLRGRTAFQHTADISYYVREDAKRRGIASELIKCAKSHCERLNIKNLLAIALECNPASGSLLEKNGFERWGFLPKVANFSGKEYGHIYYGCRLPWTG